MIYIFGCMGRSIASISEMDPLRVAQQGQTLLSRVRINARSNLSERINNFVRAS
jgi:hypothetical protein